MKKLKTLVYVTGSGRSGSTLLDMLLSTNSGIAAMGEVHRFSMNLGRDTVPFRCTCGEVLYKCPFWKVVIDEIISDNKNPKDIKTTWVENESIGENEDGTNIIEYVPPRKIFGGGVNLFNFFLSVGLQKLIVFLAPIVPSFKEGIKMIEDSWYLYEKICDSHDKKILVDGTKTPGRLLGLKAFNRSNTSIKILYLCRDGRAVTHARMNRQKLSMKDAARIWVVEHRKIAIACRSIPRSDILYVKYEDLCLQTSKTLDVIYDFIGAERQGDYSDFRDTSHSLGGNPMRLRESEREISLNEKWREEISNRDEIEFQKIGGRVNQKLGYD